MPVTISQNIVIPAGLASGQTAQASHVIPLYNALNAFLIPDTVGVFQQALIDDALTTLTIGGTVTKDYSFTVVKTKAILWVVSFTWATSGATLQPNLIFRVNAAAVTAAQLLTSAASGGGFIRVWIGPHDTTDVPRPMLVTIGDGTSVFNVMPNADLPNVDTSSVGITFGNATAGSIKLKYFRAWREG